MTNSELSPGTVQRGGPTDASRDREVYFVTSNEVKYRTAVDIFSPEITLEQAPVNVSEIQSTSPEAVVTQKAEAALGTVEGPVIVDDFSFFMDGLNKFPGPLIKHLLKETGLQGLQGLYQVSDPGCTFQCTVTIYDGEVFVVSHGELRGTLHLTSDYADPSADMVLSTVFIPKGFDRPLGELQIKNHRQKAYSELKDRILE